MEHSPINPAIFYWGTPVVLITTMNDNGTFNVAPMSSAWWIGNICMLGLAHASQTTKNLLRTQQCVLNLPSDDMTSHVNALARTTGSPIVPDGKQRKGYRHVKDKFTIASLTPEASELVSPPRIKECPVQMEAKLCGSYELLSETLSREQGRPWALEVRVLKTYVMSELRLPGHENRINADRWKPMIMSFQQLYGLREGKRRVESTLAGIDEELYSLPAQMDAEVLESETELQNGE